MLTLLKGTIGSLLTAGIIILLFAYSLVIIDNRAVDRKVQNYLDMPITQIFEADVFVPDFIQGQAPILIYTNEKKESFIGSFNVEIKNDLNVTVCTGSGTNISYTPEDIIDPQQTTLSWFLYNENPQECYLNLDSGYHYLIVNYIIKIEGLPERYYDIKSNVFTVFDKDKALELKQQQKIINKL